MYKIPLYLIMGFTLYGGIEAILSGDRSRIISSIGLLIVLAGGVLLIEKKFKGSKTQ